MNPPSIPANDFRELWREVGGDVQRAVQRVGESGWFILGREVDAFEKELAALWPLPRAIGCGTGMDAIEISLRVLGVRPGDGVLTTPLSAFATTLAIVRAGGRPVFCDVDDSGLLDLALVRSILKSRNDIRFLVPVHLYGHCLDLERLTALGRDFGVGVVEDCAQSILATHRGRACGSVGDLAATSFYPTKNLGALGDGGAILTSRDDLAEAARIWRDYGQSARYRHDVPGLNSRLDELHAAILRDAMLPRLKAWTQRRCEIAGRYRDGLDQAEAITLPPCPPGSSSVWHLFPVRVRADDREAFCRLLRDRGIAVNIHYPQLIPDQRALAGLPVEIATPLDRARAFADGEVSLPVHPYMSDADVDQVIDACLSFESPVPS